MNSLDQARDLQRRGYAVVPIPHRKKSPFLRDWHNLDLTPDSLPDYFNGKRQNIGARMGEPSGGRLDVDLDAREVRALADRFLPPTASTFGREGSPRSHWLYRATGAIPHTQQYRDPALLDGDERSMLVELRGTGCQTIMPGSTHPSGESIEWADDGEPAQIDADALTRHVSTLAAAALLARHWRVGNRHAVALALAGALLRHGWTQQRAQDFIAAVARAAGDGELDDRVTAVETTATRLEAGERASGIPTLRTLMGDAVTGCLVEWLRLNDAPLVPERPAGFSIMRVFEALQEPEENQAFVVADLLPLGGTSLIAARAKTGKTVLARSIAVNVARGDMILNRATVQGPVVYIALEEKRAEFLNSLERMGVQQEPFYLHTGPAPPTLDQAMQGLRAIIKELRPVLLVIDTLGRLIRLDDFNSYGKVNIAMEPLNTLARETGTHIMMTTHAGKTDRDNGDSVLGSTALFAAVDTLIEMKNRSGVRTVTSIQRYGVDLTETVVRLDPMTGGLIAADPLTGAAAMGAAQGQDIRDGIMKVVADAALTQKEIIELVRKDANTVTTQLRLMANEKTLTRTGAGKSGDPYRYKAPESSK